MLLSARVSVFLSQTKVYDVDQIALLAQAHEEVVRFNVPVDEIFVVNIFYSADLEKNMNEVKRAYKICKTTKSQQCLSKLL